ncbi:DotA/TraY family protein [Buttiauxella agrestis]|uniref:DotA/TraY family protein n=1 Tax=Buttiauxella agrestis TaxID=82977 RepID=UPI0039753FA0
MKLLLRLLPVIALAALSWPALADNIGFDSINSAATRSTDLSRQMMVMVFGDVVNNPLQPATASFIGVLYGVFNGIVSGMAFVWFVAIALRATVLSGNRGRVFGDGNTVMAPVSSLVGFMSLIPTPSGWSISNLVFLWTASIMGVGSANLLVDSAADSILAGQSMIVQPVAGQTVDASRGIFGMYLCQAATNAEQADMHQYGSSSTPPMGTQTSGDGREIRVTNGSALCGTARIPASADDATWYGFKTTATTAPVEAAQLNAFRTMNASLSAAAQNYVSAYRSYQDGNGTRMPDSEKIVYQAAQEYENTINRAITGINDENKIRSEMNDYLKKNGWIVLGAWYQSFATANNKVNEVAKKNPIVSGMSDIGEVGVTGLNKEINMVVAAQRQNSTYTPPLGSANHRINDSAGETNSANSVLLELMPLSQEYTANFIQSIMSDTGSDYGQQVNPLLKMKAIGDYTLASAEMTLVAFTAAKALASGATGKNAVAIAINSLTGAGDIANGVLSAIAPVVYFILFLLLSIGFSLSIFLPFIPLIYWITACTSWLATVLIGTTAGTLWAWTHIGTESDKGSRATYGYIFLIDAAIRPGLMVFGFFFASLVVVAIGTLLNILIVPAIANVQVDSVTGLASFIGILMIYARICTMLVSSAFSLQVYMPDYVIAWLGGREAAQIMKGAVESTRNMFAGFGGKMGSAPGLKKIGDDLPNSENGFK